MVPKVAGKGASFKGAALYYLHDKGALTDERVMFTHTENLPTDDPHLAIRIMIQTALAQQRLKLQAGVSTKGRKLELPVYTYSLSWAPEQAPTRGQMITAAKETLKALGLDEHETLLVAHNDEPHAHIHVIVNRVHPETGVAAKLSVDHLKLSTWAEAYEKANGKILCEQRVLNNERRRQGEYVKDLDSPRASEYRDWRQHRLRDRFEDRAADRDALAASHRAQRQALYAAKEQRIRLERRAVHEKYLSHWHTMYFNQKRDIDRLARQQAAAWKQLKAFLRSNPGTILKREAHTRKGFLAASFHTVAYGPRVLSALRKDHAQRRAWLSKKIRDRQRPILQRINEEYRRDLQVLKAKQKRERDALLKKQSDAEKEAAAALKSGKSKEQFRKERLDKRRADRKREREGPAGAFKRATRPGTKMPPILITTDEFNKAAGKKPAPLTKDFSDAARKPGKDVAAGAFNKAARKPPPALTEEFSKRAGSPDQKTAPATESERGGAAGGKEKDSRKPQIPATERAFNRAANPKKAQKGLAADAFADNARKQPAKPLDPLRARQTARIARLYKRFKQNAEEITRDPRKDKKPDKSHDKGHGREITRKPRDDPKPE